MSLYMDTSVLLKLFFAEPESARAIEMIRRESDITISSLTRLEAIIHIQSRERGGTLTSVKAEERRKKLGLLIATDPFHFRLCPAALITEAENQITVATAYCPTLDRLHLAAMRILQLRRLLTNDDAQAAAARDLGFEVILPR